MTEDIILLTPAHMGAAKIPGSLWEAAIIQMRTNFLHCQITCSSQITELLYFLSDGLFNKIAYVILFY